MKICIGCHANTIIAAFFIAALGLAAVMTPAPAQEASHAKIKTSMGDIVIALDAAKAPLTVANFLEYATSGHYDQTIFHRVAPGYIIQGGGFSQFFNERPVRDPLPYEGDNRGLLNERGTIAMARGDDEMSARAQWFINLRHNEELDHKHVEGLPLYGYTAFGRVVSGMDVADAIGAVETGPGGPFDAEVPLEPIIIERVDPVEAPQSE